MKKRLQINSGSFEFFIQIFSLLAWLIYFYGCTLTPKAIQLANKKATPRYEYWNIEKIESAVKRENGDVALCVELNKAGYIEEPELSTITIPPAILSGEANQDERHGFYPGECPIRCYWYPIEKVENGCDKIIPANLTTKSVLPIDKLTIRSQDEFYDLLNSHNRNQKMQDRIFEVSYPAADKSIIYWFVQIDQQ